MTREERVPADPERQAEGMTDAQIAATAYERGRELVAESSGHIEGETLGQYRARHGLPGTGTGAAQSIVWRDGSWRNERGAREEDERWPPTTSPRS